MVVTVNGGMDTYHVFAVVVMKEKPKSLGISPICQPRR